MNSTVTAISDRRALQSIALLFWLNGTIFAAFIPRLPEMRDQLNIGIEHLGQAISIAMLGGILGSLSVDYLCRNIGVKRLMMLSSVLVVVILASMSFTTSLWTFTIVFSLINLFDVYVDVTMNIHGSQLSERAKKPVMNRLHGLWSIGSVCGSLSAVISISLGWTLQQQLLFIAILFALLLAYIFLGLKPLVNNTSFDKPLFNKSKQWFFVIVFFVLGIAAIIPEIISSDWSAFLIRDDLKESNKIASLGFVLFGIGMMVGRLGGDEIMHRFGEMKTIFSASLTAFFGVSLVAFVDNVFFVFIGLIISGLGISVFAPILYDYAAKASGEGATMLGAMSIGLRLGAAALPVTVGYLALWQGVWVSYALLALPAILVVLLLTKLVR